MTPVKTDLTLLAPLPIAPLSPHLQEILDRELGQTDQKVQQVKQGQQVFVPTIGGKWKIKK